MEDQDKNGGTGEQGGNRGNDADGEILGRIQRLISREGGTNEAITTLLNENAGYRATNRGLREELKTAKAKVPEGAVVLQGEDAKAWEAYRAFGKPEEIKTSLEEKTTLQARLATTERNVRLRKAADTLKWDAETLDTLARTPDGKLYDFEIATEEVETSEGQKEKTEVPYIITDAEKKEKRRLEEHAKDQWAKFLPVLQPEAGTGHAARLPKQSGGEDRKGPRKEQGSFYNRPKLN